MVPFRKQTRKIIYIYIVNQVKATPKQISKARPMIYLSKFSCLKGREKQINMGRDRERKIFDLLIQKSQGWAKPKPRAENTQSKLTRRLQGPKHLISSLVDSQGAHQQEAEIKNKSSI